MKGNDKMADYNPKNERIKKSYFTYLAEAHGRADATVNGVRKALSRYEAFTGRKDFASFNKEQAIEFKKHLAATIAERTGEPLGKSTVLYTLSALKDFFRWLSCMPGYKTRIRVNDIAYLNLTDKEIRIAKATAYKDFPTLEKVRLVLSKMPTETEIDRRNRALIAFTALTVMRVNALASIRLKHIDVNRDPVLVQQMPDQVRTKFSKRIFTFFPPIGDDIHAIVLDWIKELREEKGYGDNDPVFPRTRITQDENQTFIAQGLEPICWETTEPIREIFREAFAGAGLKYYNPHSFRNMLTEWGRQNCADNDELQAFAQNLGHDSAATTLACYGTVDPYRQGEIIKQIGKREKDSDKMDMILERLSAFEKMQQKNL
ncbi:MAG: site-specific integrase [Verrucomicrobiae bacterium]|nr:site-specific integrase [Verrucomicrobiae bacterium]